MPRVSSAPVVIVMAAGQGTRMKSKTPKVLHDLLGRPMGLWPVHAALEAGAPTQIPASTTIADGIAVRAVGATPFELVKNYVDEIVTVSEGEIANAVLTLL